MAKELPKTYEPAAFQQVISRRWREAGAFRAPVPSAEEQRDRRRFAVMMPLPNVTGALHMGHSMNNVMQDWLVRWHRMQGDATLWQPGTDHAGIATQAVIEKRLFELEGKTRNDIGREALVERIWRWKDEYQARIVQQQQQMGCSCDWERQRFTMDPVCTAAVREAFFRLFRDGLIYRGDRLVNWDCQLGTAVSDDEVYHETVQGHFWHLRYPVIDPRPGEPAYVVVATTRPETMLGDTAVACHPDPAAALRQRIEEQRERAASAGARECEAEHEALRLLEQRRDETLAGLEQLVRMSRDGRRLRLPLLDRELPLITDPWAKPELGSGCVKITPAHDPNDYGVWQRHSDEIGIVNILEPDGRLNGEAGPYAGMDRLAARERVVADLGSLGCVEIIEEREIEVGHSDRSHTPIEPYLSSQWFVRMADVSGGIEWGRGTSRPRRAAGLAQLAIDAMREDWSSPSGRRVAFHPERYRSACVSWLAEKRDWCISRQLWWGHQIPVWCLDCEDAARRDALLGRLPRGHDLATQTDGCEVHVCLRGADADAAHAADLEALGFERDPDVLDTWFSSALWPLSTLGWPDPAHAPVAPGERALGGVEGELDSLACYYPTSCLVTTRDILTLWVVRMVVMGLYLQGDVPFTDVFVHAKILDGRGVTMSKSRGNGIDPIQIIERYGVDAMRYLVCELETGTQDSRLPVQAECPSCSQLVELAEAEHGRTIFTYLCTECGAEFDVLGTLQEVPAATIQSRRFEVGRNFCNKLWNAARFALLQLGELEGRPLCVSELEFEDRWILSRLARTIEHVTHKLEAYAPAAALGAARELFWGDFCDWYLELIKPRLRDPERAPLARQVLAATLDQILRLLHPFLPFITEAIWEALALQAPQRGIEAPFEMSELCIQAAWPQPHPDWIDPPRESEFERLQSVVRVIRDLRSSYQVPPGRRLPCTLRASGSALASRSALASLKGLAPQLRELARLSDLQIGEGVEPLPRSATQGLGELAISLGSVLDPARERERLGKGRARLERQLATSRGKLANDQFVSRARPQVVEAERQRLREAEAELARLTESLARLDPS